LGGSWGGVCRPPPPVVQERRERAAKARRNRWVSSERLSHHRIMREVSLFEHPHSGARAGIRDGRRPGLLFQAKSLPIPAIHGKTRSTIGVRSPRSAKARQALGEGGAVRAFCGQGPIWAAASVMARLPIAQTANASIGGSSFSPTPKIFGIPSGNGRCWFNVSMVSPCRSLELWSGSTAPS
jgi:hypothetical protein